MALRWPRGRQAAPAPPPPTARVSMAADRTEPAEAYTDDEYQTHPTPELTGRPTMTITAPALPPTTAATYVVRWTEPVEDCDDPRWLLGITLDERTADTDDELAALLDDCPTPWRDDPETISAIYQDRRSSAPDRWLNRHGNCVGCNRHPIESCYC